MPKIIKEEEVNAMLFDLKETNNKTVETYTRGVSESGCSNNKDYGIGKHKFKNKKHTERRKKTRKNIRALKTESNRKYIKNVSNLELTNENAENAAPVYISRQGQKHPSLLR